MRLDLKLAIVQSGRPQYEVAQELGVSESQLSKFIRGYGTLRPERIEKLRALLELGTEDEEFVCGKTAEEVVAAVKERHRVKTLLDQED